MQRGEKNKNNNDINYMLHTVHSLRYIQSIMARSLFLLLPSSQV